MNTYTERLETLLSEARSVYDNYNNIRDDLFKASEITVKLKKQIADQKAKGLADGSIFGKNVDERDASAREFIGDLYVKAGQAEDDEREIKNEFDHQASLVEFIRFRLRIMELLCKVASDNG